MGSTDKTKVRMTWELIGSQSVEILADLCAIAFAPDFERERGRGSNSADPPLARFLDGHGYDKSLQDVARRLTYPNQVRNWILSFLNERKGMKRLHSDWSLEQCRKRGRQFLCCLAEDLIVAVFNEQDSVPRLTWTDLKFLLRELGMDGITLRGGSLVPNGSG